MEEIHQTPAKALLIKEKNMALADNIRIYIYIYEIRIKKIHDKNKEIKIKYILRMYKLGNKNHTISISFIFWI